MKENKYKFRVGRHGADTIFVEADYVEILGDSAVLWDEDGIVAYYKDVEYLERRETRN